MTCLPTVPAYPDHAWHGQAEVMENVQVAEATYRIRLAASEIARRVVPGQFLMVRLPGQNDPLLGRPLAMYDVISDTAGDDVAVDVVYLVVGRVTSRLAELRPGTRLELWGPLGNGFSVQPTEHLIMVAGGIGQTPFLALGREMLGQRRFGRPPRDVAPAKKVTFCYGERNRTRLVGLADFERAGVEVRIATEDGSVGHRGLVTDLIEPLVKASPWPCRMAACGPEPMLAAVARLAQHLEVPCQVSLETPMACGIGACFSCVARVRDDSGSWDYKRTCVEGPIFDAERIVFADGY